MVPKPLCLLGLVAAFAQSSELPSLIRKVPAERHRLMREETGKTSVNIDDQELDKHGSDSPSDISASAGSNAGGTQWMWVKVLNKHFDPACDQDEFQLNLGFKASQEECLQAAKDNSHLGNAAIWQRGLDKNCHLCNLRQRSKAPHLTYIDSPHVDSFVQFEGIHDLYTNDGSTSMKTPGTWMVDCHNLEDDTKYITVTYGSKTDYFKPIEDGSVDFCSMLQSKDQHLWSATGAADSWQQPAYNDSSDWDVCGGSANNWPANHVAGDTRQVLSSWCSSHTGQGDPTGGYGSESGTAAWFQPFQMGYFREYVKCSTHDGSGVSSSYPCECGNVYCNAGTFCSNSTSQCHTTSVGSTSSDSGSNSNSNNNGNDNGGTDNGGSNNDGNNDGGSSSSSGSSSGTNVQAQDDGSGTSSGSSGVSAAGTSPTLQGDNAASNDGAVQAGAPRAASCGTALLSMLLVLMSY
jgi:hypothetical protein